MKLQHTIIASAFLHAVFFTWAWLTPVETQVAPAFDGWEDVQIKPVTLKTITLPKKKKIEPLPEVEAPAATPKKEETKPPKKVRKPVKKRKIKRKVVKKVEPPKPETPAKKVVSVVVSKEKTETKTVAQVTKAVVPTKTTTAPLEVAKAPATTTPTKLASASAPQETSSQGSAASAPSGAGVDVNGLIRGYNRAVYRTINKHKQYPMIARRMRLQGKVYIEVVIDAAGKIKSARVKRSSGHRVLDKEALKTVKRIGSLPSPPRQLNWSTRRLTIPMVYRFS